MDATSIDNTSHIPLDSRIEPDKYIQFAAKLYGYGDVPRNRSQSIIDDTRELVQSVIKELKREVIKILDSTNTKEQNIFKIETIFNRDVPLFKNIETEWRCLKSFKELGTYVAPKQYLIGEREEFMTENGIQESKIVPVTAEFIPIRHVFTQFFSSSRILNETINYVNSLKENKNIISNFVQGSLWTKISAPFGEKIVFPLFLYFDDFENNNPLGSHKGISKSGAVYLSIPCLPPHLVSKVQHIFLFILFNTLDRKAFSNEIIFSKVIDELNYLEKNGIEVMDNDKKISIYFKLALVVGDNLGLHSVLGFVESFNTSLFCRFCYVNRKEIHNVFDGNECILRTKDTYSADLKLNNKKLTGVVESCIFHTLSDFHVTENLSIDVMHDVLEGICQYDLGLILHSFTKVDKFFTLDDLNHRIKAFKYGANRNKPPEILSNHIKQKRLMMSASEMQSLVRHLPLIIGHLVANGNDVWEL